MRKSICKSMPAHLRNSRPDIFYKKSVLKNFKIFTFSNRVSGWSVQLYWKKAPVRLFCGKLYGRYVEPTVSWKELFKSLKRPEISTCWSPFLYAAFFSQVSRPGNFRTLWKHLSWSLRNKVENFSFDSYISKLKFTKLHSVTNSQKNLTDERLQVYQPSTPQQIRARSR